jgi:hypothetical protein
MARTRTEELATLIARVIMSAPFIWTGYTKLITAAGTQAYFAKLGAPGTSACVERRGRSRDARRVRGFAGHSNSDRRGYPRCMVHRDGDCRPQQFQRSQHGDSLHEERDHGGRISLCRRVWRWRVHDWANHRQGAAVKRLSQSPARNPAFADAATMTLFRTGCPRRVGEGHHIRDIGIAPPCFLSLTFPPPRAALTCNRATRNEMGISFNFLSVRFPSSRPRHAVPRWRRFPETATNVRNWRAVLARRKSL